MSEAIDITSIGRSHGRLTGPIFLRAVDQLHLLEFHSARSKDWPVNRQFCMTWERRFEVPPFCRWRTPFYAAQVLMAATDGAIMAGPMGPSRQ